MSVTVVIPGRDCESTLAPCLDALVAICDAHGSQLDDIIFVDDGSRDGSRTVAENRGVTVLAGTGRGAGAARNLGGRRRPKTWSGSSIAIASRTPILSAYCSPNSTTGPSPLPGEVMAMPVKVHFSPI